MRVRVCCAVCADAVSMGHGKAMMQVRLCACVCAGGRVCVLVHVGVRGIE